MSSNTAFENAIEKGVNTIIKALKAREKWWLLRYIVVPIFCVWLGVFLTNRYHQEKLLTIPTTVVDRKTGNVLHIEKPIPRSTYYEFPIILHDGENYRRIDKYAYAKELGIKLK